MEQIKKTLGKMMAVCAVATATGCASTNQWALENQGNLNLINTGANVTTAAGTLMSGISSISSAKSLKKISTGVKTQNRLFGNFLRQQENTK